MKISMIPNALGAAYKTGQSIEFISPPGVGKSMAVDDFCAQMSVHTGQPFGEITFMLTTIAPPDYGGFLYPAVDPYNENGRRLSAFSQPPVLPHPIHFKNMRGGSYRVYIDGKAVETFDGIPEQGIIFLDEYGQSDIDLKKMSADLVLNRRIRGEALPNGWSVALASNRQEDRSGVTKEMAFALNRKTRVPVTNNISDWRRWAAQNHVHHLAIAWASFKPDAVFVNEAPPAGQQFCSPRSLVSASKFFKTFEASNSLSFTFDPDNPSSASSTNAELLDELVRGTIGEDSGRELMNFGRMAEHLPTFEDIVKDPQGAPLPAITAPDALHAVCDMVASRVTSATAKQAFDYILRVPREFQVATLASALQTNPALMESSKFAPWINKNRSLVIAANSA